MDAQTILNGCNEAQRLAIAHDHARGGPLLILAGAGSGKTSVLARRVQWLVSCCALSPTCILGLTFTAQAAAEMRERIALSGPLLCTFHALAWRLLRENVLGTPNWRRLGFARNPEIREGGAADWLGHLSERGLSPRKFPREALFCPDFLGNPTWSALRRGALQRACVNFDDLIWIAVDLLERFAEVRLAVRERWKHCLVDEYQDINPPQYRLMRAITGDNPNLFVVGDDDQAIYGFRGADVGNILRFREDFPRATVIKLEWNYRSTPSILSIANRIFSEKPEDMKKVLRAGSLRADPLFALNAPVEFWESSTSWEEIRRLVRTLWLWKTDYRLEWRNFAILVRFHRQGEWYACALRYWGIPADQGDDSVRIETLHASKGLQYPVVFYAGLAADLSPARYYRGEVRNRSAHLAEERRLFYVGVTRAESRLVLLFCRRRHWQGGLRSFRYSPFLKALRVDGSSRLRRLCMMSVLRLWKYAVIIAYMARAAWRERLLRLRGDVPQEWIDRVLLEWARFSLNLLEYRCAVHGREYLDRVDWNRPVFVVSNHQSYVDIPALLVALDRRVGFVAKRELVKIPLLGYWMRRIGCLLIDRQKKGVGQEIARDIQAMGEKPHIAMFPEGTRSKTGEMGLFKSGAFRYARAMNGIILPVVLRKTRDSWENRRRFGTWVDGSCEILEPVDLSLTPLPPKLLQHEIRARMREALRRG